MTKAKVTTMIKDRETECEKEAVERNAMKTELVNDLKSTINLEFAMALSNQEGGAKCLRAAGSNTNAASTNATEGQQESIAERFVSSLIEKFHVMGSKVRDRSG